MSQAEKEPLHIDDFIDYGLDKKNEPNEVYARWMFSHFRLPAVCKYDFDQFMSQHKLFCVYNGVKYRVTGASRLGDVWLTTNFDQDAGYTERVDVESCSEWSKE